MPYPRLVQHYLRYGEANGLASRYKCRIRQFWYAVPHVRIADAFLSYMSGEQPLLVTNAANLVAPNTVHVLRFARNCEPLPYAASWRSSLTRLSCELEGHALGRWTFQTGAIRGGECTGCSPSRDAGSDSCYTDQAIPCAVCRTCYRNHRSLRLEKKTRT